MLVTKYVLHMQAHLTSCRGKSNLLYSKQTVLQHAVVNAGMEILGLVIRETTASDMMETRLYFLQTDITFTD